MDRKKALEIGYRQLAIDYNAQPGDFQKEGVTFTAPALNPGRRVYSDKLPFFEMATVGASAVIMADERLYPALRDWIKGVEEPHWLLEFPRLLGLLEILKPYGYELTQTFHHYLPAGDFAPMAVPENVVLEWLERREIERFYPNESWPNALQEEENPVRPDVLVLMALDGNKPAVMAGAGASADSPGMWQIGIDVRPEYRGRGLGTLLVRNLAAEVEKRGALPFYGTSLSNIHSQNIAWKCGFRPAWAAISARKAKE